MNCSWGSGMIPPNILCFETLSLYGSTMLWSFFDVTTEDYGIVVE